MSPDWGLLAIQMIYIQINNVFAFINKPTLLHQETYQFRIKDHLWWDHWSHEAKWVWNLVKFNFHFSLIRWIFYLQSYFFHEEYSPLKFIKLSQGYGQLKGCKTFGNKEIILFVWLNVKARLGFNNMKLERNGLNWLYIKISIHVFMTYTYPWQKPTHCHFATSSAVNRTISL